MKLFKYFYLPILIIILSFNILLPKIFPFKKMLDPKTNKNDFLVNFQQAMSLTNYKPINLIIRDHENEMEFYLKIQQKPIKIIFSTNKDPLAQLYTLQQILKKDKIKELPTIIDLNSKKAYVSF